LAVGQRETIELVVTITPGNNTGPFENQVRGTAQGPDGTPVDDLSTDGTDSDPDNNGDPTDNSTPTQLGLSPRPILGVAKTVASVEDVGEGNFQVTYNIAVENQGDVPLSNLQVTEDLSTTFGTVPFAIARVAVPSGNFAANDNYDGTTNTNLLTGDGTLAVGQRETIELVVTITPGNNTGPFENQVQGTAQGPDGTPVDDLSTDGTDSDPDDDGDPTNDSDPTFLEVVQQPRLRLVKRVTNVTRGGVPISGIDFNSFIRDSAAAIALNAAGLTPVGVTEVDPADPLQSGDVVEYTVYFISDGNEPANAIRLCDAIPQATTYIRDSFAPGRGIALLQGTTETLLTDASDADPGTFFEPLTPVAVPPCPNPGNPNGSVFADLGDITNATPNNVGFIRFRVRID
jgi:uncharacterized repeat protein (TIGR01451 family)